MSKLETVPAKAGTHIPGSTGIDAATPSGGLIAQLDGVAAWARQLPVPTRGVVSATALIRAVQASLAARDRAGAESSSGLSTTIMNLEMDETHDAFTSWTAGEREAYMCGHRDARRAAAGLATRVHPAAEAAVAPAADSVTVRAAFIEWHTDKFGYCFDDEKSFTDGDLQAVAWEAWQEAHVRAGATAAPPSGALPKTGVAATEVVALLGDLARVGAAGAGEVPGLCQWAGAVVQGLLLGLDVEQLS